MNKWNEKCQEFFKKEDFVYLKFEHGFTIPISWNVSKESTYPALIKSFDDFTVSVIFYDDSKQLIETLIPYEEIGSTISVSSAAYRKSLNDFYKKCAEITKEEFDLEAVTSGAELENNIVDSNNVLIRLLADSFGEFNNGNIDIDEMQRILIDTIKEFKFSEGLLKKTFATSYSINTELFKIGDLVYVTDERGYKWYGIVKSINESMIEIIKTKNDSPDSPEIDYQLTERFCVYSVKDFLEGNVSIINIGYPEIFK